MKSTVKHIACLLAALLFAVAASPGMAGDRMDASAMGNAFRGIILDGVYADGAFFSETYFEDGAIRYHDVNGADSGEWSVRDETFCTFYERQDGGCFFVERDGDNCFTFYEAVENEDGHRTADTRWSSRGWNRDRPATCPTPPEADV